MPTVTASWKRVTSRPRSCFGATSEMYTGHAAEARPMAMPIRTLPAVSTSTLPASADRVVPTMKMSAETMIVRRRP